MHRNEYYLITKKQQNENYYLGRNQKIQNRIRERVCFEQSFKVESTPSNSPNSLGWIEQYEQGVDKNLRLAEENCDEEIQNRSDEYIKQLSFLKESLQSLSDYRSNITAVFGLKALYIRMVKLWDNLFVPTIENNNDYKTQLLFLNNSLQLLSGYRLDNAAVSGVNDLYSLMVQLKNDFSKSTIENNKDVSEFRNEKYKKQHHSRFNKEANECHNTINPREYSKSKTQENQINFMNNSTFSDSQDNRKQEINSTTTIISHADKTEKPDKRASLSFFKDFNNIHKYIDDEVIQNLDAGFTTKINRFNFWSTADELKKRENIRKNKKDCVIHLKECITEGEIKGKSLTEIITDWKEQDVSILGLPPGQTISDIINSYRNDYQPEKTKTMMLIDNLLFLSDPAEEPHYVIP